MGADFAFAVVEMKATREEAYAKARYLTLPNNIEATTADLENYCGVNEWYDLESPTEHQVYEFLKRCIDTVYDSDNRRDCGFFVVDSDRLFFITGGMSWGDPPTDVYDDFAVCQVMQLTFPPPALV